MIFDEVLYWPIPDGRCMVNSMYIHTHSLMYYFERYLLHRKGITRNLFIFFCFVEKKKKYDVLDANSKLNHPRQFTAYRMWRQSFTI